MDLQRHSTMARCSVKYFSIFRRAVFGTGSMLGVGAPAVILGGDAGGVDKSGTGTAWLVLSEGCLGFRDFISSSAVSQFLYSQLLAYVTPNAGLGFIRSCATSISVFATDNLDLAFNICASPNTLQKCV